MMIEAKCPKGVPFSEQGWAQKCHDECEHQEFQGTGWPVTIEKQLSDEYDGDWEAGYGCHWDGWYCQTLEESR